MCVRYGCTKLALVVMALVLLGPSVGVSLNALQARVPSPWLDVDVGTPAIAGSASVSGSSFTIAAGGTDIWDSSDQFHFVYQPVTGDVDIRARIDSVANAASWSKAGVMIRSGLAANAAHGFALVSAAKGTAFQRRTEVGGLSTHTAGTSVVAPQWVRLVRRGAAVSAYTSGDGTTWALLGRDTIALGTTAYVGLAATSHNASAATTAIASQVTLTPLGLPSGQQHADIGSPALPGDASYSNGTYLVHAGGADIWGTSDQFHYVYQPVSGDVDVSVRVAAVSYASAWSKAGVMIRETLAPGSAHAFALLSAAQGYGLQRRPVAGGVSLHTSGGAGAAPGWVRLKRNGSLFTAYRSSDGKNWTLIGSDSIAMADSVYVGIAVTSHNAAAATDAVIDSFSQTSPANQPPVVAITSPTGGATFTAPASIVITANASDPEGQLTGVDFYNGTTLLGSDTTAPYSFTWGSVPAGSYTLTAVARDAGGSITQSAAVAITASTTTTSVPQGVVFHASTDDGSVTSYRVEVFTALADTSTASPIAWTDIGKPAPDANGDMTALIPSFFQALTPGDRQLTVTAVSGSLSTRSVPVAFTR